MARSTIRPLFPAAIITISIIATSAAVAAVPARAQDQDVGGLDELIAQLAHADPTIRADAAEKLGTLGPAAKAAVPALERVLTDRFAYVRESASNALVKIGPAGVSDLIGALDGADEGGRLRALDSLKKLGAGAEPALPALIKLLKDPAFKWRFAVADALVAIGEPSVAPLIELLKGDDAFAREVASGTLRELGAPAARALCGLVNSDQARIRHASVKLLEEMGPRAQVAVPDLANALVHSDWIVAIHARHALVAIGKPAVTSLVLDLTKTRDKARRRAIAETLAEMGRIAEEEAAKPLLRMLQDGDPHVRIAAARAVWRIAGDSGNAVSVLTGAVKSDDEEIHGHAAEVLGAMGKDAADATRTLREMLKSGSLERRETACWILWRIGPDARDALEALLEALASEERSLRETAAQALGTVGLRQKKAIDALNERLGDEVPRVRVAAAIALGKVSNDTAGAVQVLIAALTGDDEAIRGSAARGLADLGAASVDQLSALMRGADGKTRAAAAFILVRVGEPAVPALAKLLEKSRDPELRRLVAESLGSIGPEAKGALDALKQAAKGDDDAGVRSAATAAIGRVEGETPLSLRSPPWSLARAAGRSRSASRAGRAPRPVSQSTLREGNNPMASITLKGNAISTCGDLPAVGSAAPDFTLVKQDLSPAKLGDFAGKKKVLNIFPSVDTPVCATSVRRFNEAAAKLENAVVLNISADLPFAQKRFCGAEGIEGAHTLSTLRSSFAKDYGLEITSGPLAGLCSRAIVVLDGDGKVVYTEQVPEIAQEPDYDKALAALK